MSVPFSRSNIGQKALQISSLHERKISVIFIEDSRKPKSGAKTWEGIHRLWKKLWINKVITCKILFSSQML